MFFFRPHLEANSVLRYYSSVARSQNSYPKNRYALLGIAVLDLGRLGARPLPAPTRADGPAPH